MSELETCGKCMGGGYGGHPDSGVLCADCNGSGGVPVAPKFTAAELGQIFPDGLPMWLVKVMWQPETLTTGDLRRMVEACRPKPAALEAPDAGVVAELVEALREARLMVNTNTLAGKLWDDNARALIAKLETRPRNERMM